MEVSEAPASSEDKERARLGGLLVARLLLAGMSLGLAVAIDRVDPHGTPGIWGVYWTIVAAFMATMVSHRSELWARASAQGLETAAVGGERQHGGDE